MLGDASLLHKSFVGSDLALGFGAKCAADRGGVAQTASLTGSTFRRLFLS